MALAQRIQQLMKGKGDRVADASRRAGVPYATMYDIVKGRTANPEISNLRKIAEAYGTTLDWLLSDNGGPTLVREPEAPYRSQFPGMAEPDTDAEGWGESALRNSEALHQTLTDFGGPGQRTTEKLFFVRLLIDVAEDIRREQGRRIDVSHLVEAQRKIEAGEI